MTDTLGLVEPQNSNAIAPPMPSPPQIDYDKLAAAIVDKIVNYEVKFQAPPEPEPPAPTQPKRRAAPPFNPFYGNTRPFWG